MSNRPDVVTLHGIGAARSSHGLVEEILRQVIANRAKPDDQPVVGMLDLDFIRMESARSKLSLLDRPGIEAVAGPAAGAALRGFLDAFDPIEAAYGRVSGPDRTHAQVASAGAVMAAAAEEALAHLMEYWREVGGLEIPGLAEYVEALEASRAARGPYPPPEPRSGVPRVRQPLDGSVTAPRARILLGRSFGVMAGIYLRSGVTPTPTIGAVAGGDLAGLAAYVGIRSGSLAARMAAVDFDIRDELADAAKALDDLGEAYLAAIEGPGVPVEALPDLRARTLACVRETGVRIRRVERLAALRGYDLDPAPEPAAPAPR